MARRVIWIVIDSVGAGELPDAEKYNDSGADTLGHIFKAYPDMKVPNMKRLGLCRIDGVSFVKYDDSRECIGAYCKSMEKSNGKDTTTGHWEMIGIYTDVPFPTYPDGFPKEIINEFIDRTGCGSVYGNKVASGVPIIAEYGEEHMKTGYPIVYTSADSVFQIAASEEKVGLDRLYEYCSVARDILQGENAVGRVIARPFVRAGNGFERTSNRRDYALEPSEDNILEILKQNGQTVAAVGKISDIFAGVGISDSVHTKSNEDGMDKTLDYIDKYDEGLIFTNLVDFDMKFGHRRDAEGYKNALEQFDLWLGDLIGRLNDDDILIVNSDHGCDPAYKGSDHTREYIPVMIYGKNLRKDNNLGILDSFADIGKTVLEYLLPQQYDKIKTDTIGKSFLDRL